MRRVIARIINDWPLKVAAILLATLLYAGLIVSASADSFQGRIPIEVLNQPPETFVLGDIEDVTSVRYIAIGTDRPQVTSSTFTATADLTGLEAVAGAPPQSVPVVVRSVDPAIQVIDYAPSRIAIRLDPLVSREVPVSVDLGTVPPGLDVREPVVSEDPVVVSGPDSSVRFVTAALARVRIDPSGIDVNETVGLIPVDARGEVVDGVAVEPSSVRVTIQIGSQLATKTLPVEPVVTGAPASTHEISAVEVQPALVTVEGEADVLAGLVTAPTRSVSIQGATADVVAEVALDLPEGVSAVGVDKVEVLVTIRPRSGTRTVEAGVEIVNGDPDLVYLPGVDRVMLTLGGTAAALDSVDAATLTARLDVAGLGPGTVAVPVSARLPSGVSLVAASPGEVSVTIRSLATPTPVPTPEPAAATPSPTPTPEP